MKPLKIAFFTDTYEPQVNGVVKFIKLTRKYLEKSGNEVQVFAPSHKDCVPGKNVHCFRSFDFLPYPDYRVAIPHRLLLWALMRKSRRPDIVHLQTPASLGAAGLIFAKYYKIPCVATFHTLISEYTHYLMKDGKIKKILGIEKITKKAIWKYTKWFLNSCDAVTVPSEEVKRLLVKNGVKKPVEVLPGGIEIPRKRDKKSLRKKYGFGEKEKILLSVGRLGKEKNIDFILRSMKLLEERGFSIVIVGKGPYENELRKKAEKLGLTKVLFTGFLSDSELMDYYSMADVFVSASKTETQGIVLLEACFSGLPLVSIEAPVVSDFIRKYGLGIVSGCSEKDFAAAVRKLFTDRKMLGKIRNGQKRALHDLNAEECTLGFERLYRKMIERKSRAN